MIELKNGYYFGIASDLSSISEMRFTIGQSFITAFIFVLLFGIVGGVIVSHRFLSRVDRIARIAKNIGSGQLHQRIPLSGANDDLTNSHQ